MKIEKKPLSGGEAIAYAFKQVNVDVFSMYPITPQTPIIETFSRYHSKGEVTTELILVESEHSALSATIGAATSGVRAVTATASQGLMYMYEMLSVASGMRLPIVMPVANRAISAPINIHCDHSDAMACLDQGWIMAFCENAQEAYQMSIFSFRLAESVYLPMMICIDGFYTSHNVETVEVFDEKKVKKFVGKFKPKYNLLDVEKPISIGSLSLPDTFFEIKKEMFDAFLKVKDNFLKIAKDFKKTFNKEVKIYEDYFAKKSDVVIVLLSSSASNAKDVIDKLRKEGKNVGLLRPVLFRPFLYEEYFKVLKDVKKIIVLDRAEGPGSMPPLYKDIKLTVADNPKKQEVYSHVFGLGGRDLLKEDIEKILLTYVSGKKINEKYLGLKK